MAKCSRCGAETQLFDNGVPICLPCASAQEAQKKTGVDQDRIVHGREDITVISSCGIVFCILQ